MKRMVGGILGLVILAVVGFLIVGASQQTELRVIVPPGAKAFIDGKPFKPCKHEDVPKGQGCDPNADVQRQFRWFVNGGKTYRVSVRTPDGEAMKDVEIGETVVSLHVTIEDGQPKFDDGSQGG